MMKIIVIGATGMLGQDVVSAFEKSGHTCVSFHSRTIDIRDARSVDKALAAYTQSDFLINCAAYTKVDDCETEQALAHSVNAKGPKHLALWCKVHSIPIVHFSTDYVFDGKKETPYVESDTCAPISVYGDSKWQGELSIKKHVDQHLIFRVQWLYGKHGSHFIDTLRGLLKDRESLSMVSDQHGSPTWTLDIANTLVSIIEAPPEWGTYHLRAQGATTWYDYACTLRDLFEETCKISPQKTEDYPRPAKRPKNGTLNTGKSTACGFVLPHWRDSVNEYVKKLRNQSF